MAHFSTLQIFLTSTAAALALLPASAIAQNAPVTPDAAQPQPGSPVQTVSGQATEADSAPGEIVVTAQKRSENLQKVPIAITVVSSAQLAQQQINTVIDLKRSAPALEFAQPGQSPGGGGFIRGLGTTITSSTAEPSVGIVIDGVPQGNVPQTNIFDVSRVEVLRGPQGTLYGQSVSAGLVNIVTNAPKLGEFSGYAQGEFGNNGTAGSDYSRRIGRAVVNVPLGQNAAFRIAGHYDSIDDVSRDDLTGIKSNRDDRGLRGRLLWEPSDAVTINLIGDYNQINTKNPPYFSVYKTGDAGLANELAACGITLGGANGDNCTPVTQTQDEKTYGFSGQIDIKLGTHTLTSITAYRADKMNEVASIDGLPAASPTSPYPNITYGPSTYDQYLFSQEIRLSSPTGNRLEYVVGGYFSRYHATRDYVNNLQLFFLPVPLTTAYIRTPQVQSLAAFGQATYKLTDQLRLIAGGRYTSNEVQARSDVLSNPGEASGYFTGHSTVHNFSWKGGAQYDITSRIMAYATFSRGFKGQTYDDDSDLSVNPRYVKPEIPTAVEIGLKGQVFSNKLGFDLNLFHTHVKDYQAQVCTPDLQRGLVCAAENISVLTSKGVELDLYGQPIRGLSINGGVIYVHATYPKGFFGTDGTDLGGYQVINSARWKATASAEYQTRFTDSMKGFVGGDTVYRSRVRYITAGTDDVTFRPHFITGGRLGVRLNDDKYEIAIFGRNLFNVHEPTLRYNSAIATATYTQILTDASYRVVGLSGNVKF
jgi:iron complex outermembrane receptor protein